MKKQPEITDMTRKAYVDAFIQEYKKKDINKITVRELVNITNTSKATFYRYFQDVYAIFEYIESSVLEQFEKKMTACIACNASERHLVDSMSEIYYERRIYLEVLFKENGLDSFRRRLADSGKDKLLQNLNLTKDDIRLSYILDYYMTAVITIIGRWINHPNEMSKEEIIQLIKCILSQGVLEQLKNN